MMWSSLIEKGFSERVHVEGLRIAAGSKFCIAASVLKEFLFAVNG